MIFDAELGPVTHLVVSFPGNTVPTKGLEVLRALDESGRIDILDLEFVIKDEDGTVRWVEASDVGAEAFAASASELIDGEDVAEVGEAMEAGSVAIILIWEDRTLMGVLETWSGESGSVLSAGPVAVAVLVRVLEDTEEN